MHFYRKCWFDPFEEQFISPFLSDCLSLMLGIAIHCIQHSQAMLERGVCELAHSFFHFESSIYYTNGNSNACALSSSCIWWVGILVIDWIKLYFIIKGHVSLDDHLIIICSMSLFNIIKPLLGNLWGSILVITKTIFTIHEP